MAQSRNPSERNKVGEKQKKKQAWWESALDVAGNVVSGVGKTAVDNISKVGQVGGNVVKGTLVDPLMWAANNPKEVGKTFVNPERATTWLTDNLLAGKEIEKLLTGNAGLSDAAIAAMALLPIGNIADDAVKAAIRGGERAATVATEDVIRAAQQAFESQGKNPYSALYSGVRGEAKAGSNLAQTRQGMKVNRPFEAPVGTPNIDPNELDNLIAAVLGDTSILQKGGSQYLNTLKGLKQRVATNEGRMGKIMEPVRILEEALLGTPKNTPEYRALLNARKRLIEENVTKQQAAVKAENRFSNRK